MVDATDERQPADEHDVGDAVDEANDDADEETSSFEDSPFF